jgi:hypothetical protein
MLLQCAAAIMTEGHVTLRGLMHVSAGASIRLGAASSAWTLQRGLACWILLSMPNMLIIFAVSKR